MLFTVERELVGKKRLARMNGQPKRKIIQPPSSNRKSGHVDKYADKAAETRRQAQEGAPTPKQGRKRHKKGKLE